MKDNPYIENIHSSTNTNKFAIHETQDHKVTHAVRLEEKIRTWSKIVIIGSALCIVAHIFFANLKESSALYSLFNAFLASILAIIACAILLLLLEVFILKPYRFIRYSACIKEMIKTLPSYGIDPELIHRWRLPKPSLMALDTQQSVLMLQTPATDYYRLFLRAGEILEIKVERKTVVETKTEHNEFFSSSSSKSVAIESAFLEIHYQRFNDQAPEWIVIPYGEARQDADAMAVAIRRIMLSH